MLEAHRMYYKLIRMINEFCEIFKYPLASLLLLLICMTCVTGYSCCRALFGKPLMINAPITECLTLFLNINYLLELYILTLTTNLTSKLHENILHDLRTTFCDSDLVERSNVWLALQITSQNTSINIFGVLNINLQLIFPLVSGIILHIIYIIQSDYNYM
ncbi:putative gustatory receptor 85a [Drosophila hydei]|uniref:Gustatory receptor 85a n=1 Tax=Drosophila hydei TaxID=7224 RepID=A0A6J1MBR7_DROHY|nr:putative gustatory receptor 85a [Drosophila hydei]